MDAMKIHFNSENETDALWLVGVAACGAGKGRTMNGIYASRLASEVTCKRCLKKIEDQIVEKENVPLTAEERLARIADYIKGEGDIDNRRGNDFLDGRNSVLRAIRDLVEDKH